jgi:Heterokaryon incompatibility protein (HET)
MSPEVAAYIAWIFGLRKGASANLCYGTLVSFNASSIRHVSNKHLMSDPQTAFWLRTPKSLDTSSDEVFALAHNWISKCKCADSWSKPGYKWYPKRLIDLENLRGANGLKELDNLTFFSEHANLERSKVRLVEPDAHATSERENNRYVTLSHCWGKPKSVQGQLKLTSQTEDRLKTEGIELRELSKTFRDAMLFACRLENVGYIWIDSLCIKQAMDSGLDPGDSEGDWLEQSRVMDKIYRESYLNISATAASDGDQGLFFQRRPEDLWEDEINLNLTGLIRPDQEPERDGQAQLERPADAKIVTKSNQTMASNNKSVNLGEKWKFGATYDLDCPRKLRRTQSIFDAPVMKGQIGYAYLKRCTIINAAFWDDLVEQAPVNQRGWVLQERLMARRVLHFCHNQIAWECSESQKSEGHPEGFPILRFRDGDIVDEGSLKSLKAVDGLRLRKIRLRGFPDPDGSLKNLHVYELWKRIVEVYSRTKLTMSRDKLIALSGIAREFSKQTKCSYVAGMWRTHLESQLLWQVNEVFKDGSFLNHAKRDPSRAPSFSWAALDTPYGIVYGEATDYGKDRAEELLFQVKSYQLLSDPKNEFDLIEGSSCSIIVTPRHLRRIKFRKLQPPQTLPYCWRFADGTPNQKSIEYSNLSLDAPETDLDIFKPNAELFCMPAAFGERTVKKSSRYLICLLLKLEKNDKGFKQYKRFGLAKLSNFADQAGQKALREQEFNQDICIW